LLSIEHAASIGSITATAKRKNVAAIHATDVLALHAPKLLLSRYAVKCSGSTRFCGMVQHALLWHRLTAVERAAYKKK
jgi:hypothetical protein